MVARFVPAADEVFRLQTGDDAECRFFQSFCDEGHYRGASRDSTRQGTYAVTPGGRLLGSINTTDAAQMRAFLERALAQWDALPPADRRAEPPTEPAGNRWETRGYPVGGLVLRVFTRDLPRDTPPVAGWRGQAWNKDYAWFRPEEARAFLPARIAKGQAHAVPRALVERLARFHLVDNVRGQTTDYRAEHVEVAEMTTRIVKIKKAEVTIEIEGRTRVIERGRWGVDDHPEGPQERGIEAKLAGQAVYDGARGRFVRFEVAAACARWGGTRFNRRGDDLAPQGLGVALVLAGDGPEERVAPAFIWGYGWR